MQSITLYFREGASDKVYQANLEPGNGGWTVRFAYGRRGSTLSTGTKTRTPVSREEALRIYDKLVREKIAKGYTPGEDGIPYQGATDKPDTGIRPQLLTAVGDEELPRLLADDAFVLQPKLDGRRLLLRKEGQTVIGINRKGLQCGIPETIRASALQLPGDYLLDGEAVGDVLHVFDLLQRSGDDLRTQPYRRRTVALLNLLAEGKPEKIIWVPSYFGKTEKRTLFDQLKSERAEGVVFKRLAAPYVPGRPASGGDQRKFKFVETASVIVTHHNARRSIAFGLLGDDGILVPAGNVSIPIDQPIPGIGAVVEVRYLYAFPESGVLFQPVYLGLREDIDPAECVRSQLKYKAELLAA